MLAMIKVEVIYMQLGDFNTLATKSENFSYI